MPGPSGVRPKMADHGASSGGRPSRRTPGRAAGGSSPSGSAVAQSPRLTQKRDRSDVASNQTQRYPLSGNQNQSVGPPSLWVIMTNAPRPTRHRPIPHEVITQDATDFLERGQVRQEYGSACRARNLPRRSDHPADWFGIPCPSPTCHLAGELQGKIPRQS